MKGQRAEELHLSQLLPRRNNPADARPLLCPACPRGDASSSLPPEPLGGVVSDVLISKTLRAPCGVVLLLPASSPSVTPALEARGGFWHGAASIWQLGASLNPPRCPPASPWRGPEEAARILGQEPSFQRFPGMLGPNWRQLQCQEQGGWKLSWGGGGGNLGVQDSVGELCAPNSSALKRCQPAAGVPGCCAPSACFMG